MIICSMISVSTKLVVDLYWFCDKIATELDFHDHNESKAELLWLQQE